MDRYWKNTKTGEIQFQSGGDDRPKRPMTDADWDALKIQRLDTMMKNAVSAGHNSDDIEIGWMERGDPTLLAEHQAWKDTTKTVAQKRSLAYPKLQEQLDMQYWDLVDGTTKWKDHIAKVKTDNPKE